MRRCKTITRVQYYQLLGLLTLAEKYNKLIGEIETATAEIVGVADPSGHVMDTVWGSRTLDQMLELMEVEVEDGVPA